MIERGTTPPPKPNEPIQVDMVKPLKVSWKADEHGRKVLVIELT
jgi:hypothetical protein